MSQRQHILDSALALMAEGGAEGMSMRDLAAAAGINVATLYHYFPSKRELLVAVLEQPGHREVLLGELPEAGGRDVVEDLVELLCESWRAMVSVAGYVRVMIGETLRGDPAALAVGAQLLASTEADLRGWVHAALGLEGEPATTAARLLRAVIVGVFVEQLAAAEEGSTWCAARADELAPLLAASCSALR